jgi:hypothetical protein
MNAMFTHPLRSRWFAALVHAGLWTLLVLALAGLGGRAPYFAASDAPSAPPDDPIPTGIIQRLFGLRPPLATLNDTNLLSPFFTRHFEPPVVPPPTTRKVELTYHGFFQTTDGPLTALVKVGDNILPVVVGGRAIADLAIADITWQTLTLTNAAARTNLLPLNLKKDLEVPIP